MGGDNRLSHPPVGKAHDAIKDQLGIGQGGALPRGEQALVLPQQQHTARDGDHAEDQRKVHPVPQAEVELGRGASRHGPRRRADQRGGKQHRDKAEQESEGGQQRRARPQADPRFMRPREGFRFPRLAEEQVPGKAQRISDRQARPEGHE